MHNSVAPVLQSPLPPPSMNVIHKSTVALMFLQKRPRFSQRENISPAK